MSVLSEQMIMYTDCLLQAVICQLAYMLHPTVLKLPYHLYRSGSYLTRFTFWLFVYV